MKLPSEYTPLTPEEFIGHTRKRAELALKFVRSAQSAGAPLKLFWSGPPGVGKSALCRFIIHHLGVHPSECQPLNGTELTLERIQEIKSTIHYRPMLSQWRVIWVDEIDQSTHKAQAFMLTMLDNLPRYTAFLCTCNSRIAELEERFQTRFAATEIQPPSQEELAELLTRKFSVQEKAAGKIAQFAKGNVRQALLDADSAVLMAA